MLMADDARRILQDLPMRIPIRLGLVLQLTGGRYKLLAQDVAVWLHTVHGDPITGREGREFRRELFKKENESETMEDPMLDTGTAAGKLDSIRAEVVIEDPPSTGMPRAYLDGLSDVQFSVTGQFSQHRVVATRWEVNGSHTGILLGQPATGRTVTVTGVTVLKFAEAPDAEGNPAFTATEEWTCWDLPSLLAQTGAKP